MKADFNLDDDSAQFIPSLDNALGQLDTMDGEVVPKAPQEKEGLTYI